MRNILNLVAATTLGIFLSTTPSMAIPFVTADLDPISSTAQPPALSTEGPGDTFQNVTGAETNIRKSPWDTLGCEATCPYNSVSAFSSLTYFIGLNRTSLTMMWGSPDPGEGRNLIEFLDGEGNVVDSYNGDMLLALTGGPASVGFATVYFTAVNLFQSIRLSDDSQNAFEFAFSTVPGENGPEAVPLPAGIILLLSGLMGLGVLGRKRVKTA
ncbi:MAG TPA: VPLPA-CTERM sorting domain-containing protein [Aestuariivirga sp.]|nr:VPLPA-CTERM sorting domain-containing protein [Aestuariivirga sp.]